MKLLTKKHIADSQYSDLNLELHQYFAGNPHKVFSCWGDEGDAIYKFETAPDNVGHNRLFRAPINWDALSEKDAEAAEYLSAEDFMDSHPNAVGEMKEIWNSEV